eukprot:jgi/Psemu1/282938/fgenesh1_pg.16_\
MAMTSSMIAPKSDHSSVLATTIRFFGTPAKKAAENPSTTTTTTTAARDTPNYEKLVEESIKKLMTTTSRDDTQDDLKPISNDELESRLNYYKKVFEEAELCLSDLRETLFEVDDEQYREETKCAEGAVNNAFTAYIDLLEDLQRCSEDQQNAYSEVRNSNACNLRRLRKELESISKVAENRVRASS